jgi:hypothetical protein
MSDAYKVVLSKGGCASCNRGCEWDVVGPDGAALSQSWVDNDEERAGFEEAEKVAEWLSSAYELGRAAAVPPPKAFTVEPPEGDIRVLVWDEEIKLWSNLWWYPGKVVDAEFLKLHYTHWLPEPPAPHVPGVEPATAIAPPVADDWDNIPF